MKLSLTLAARKCLKIGMGYKFFKLLESGKRANYGLHILGFCFCDDLAHKMANLPEKSYSFVKNPLAVFPIIRFVPGPEGTGILHVPKSLQPRDTRFCIDGDISFTGRIKAGHSSDKRCAKSKLPPQPLPEG